MTDGPEWPDGPERPLSVEDSPETKDVVTWIDEVREAVNSVEGVDTMAELVEAWAQARQFFETAEGEMDFESLVEEADVAEAKTHSDAAMKKAKRAEHLAEKTLLREVSATGANYRKVMVLRGAMVEAVKHGETGILSTQQMAKLTAQSDETARRYGHDLARVHDGVYYRQIRTPTYRGTNKCGLHLYRSEFDPTLSPFTEDLLTWAEAEEELE